MVMTVRSFCLVIILLLFVSCGSPTKKVVPDNDQTGVDDSDQDQSDDSEIPDDKHVSDTCGNDVIDEGEICDGNLINCVDINDRLYLGGKAWCREDCTGYDTVTCEEVFHECGNDVIEGPEECDGGLIECVELDPHRFSGGKAACESDCSGWDTITCDEREPFCGDGLAELGEVCDGETKKCIEIDSKYYLGSAQCNDTCDGWLLDDCVEGKAECGNDIVEGFELCDGSIDDCVSIDPVKYSGGKAYCKDDCSGWDTITCTEKSGVIDWNKGFSYTGSFEPRSSHCAAFFNNKFWIVGGSGADGTFSDVWSSTDAISWTREVESGPFGQRQRHKCVVYDGKLWVIGGRDGSGTHLSKVWYSSNGVTWNEDVFSLDDFLPGSNSEVLVKGTSLYVFSVATNFLSPSKGVWERNIHGWKRVSQTVPYGTDSSFAGGVLDGTFYLTGGVDAGFSVARNIIWYSNDGIEWESAPGDFIPRAFHSVVVIDGSLFMIGGNNLMTRSNDVLKSGDGLKWGVVTSNAGFTGRSSHAVAKSLNKLCVIGGTNTDGVNTNDVWCTDI